MNTIIKQSVQSLKDLSKTLESNPMIVNGLAIALLVYVAFVEDERDSMLHRLMNNMLGRLLVLIILVALTSLSPVLGVLFGVLVVLSSSYGRRGEGFTSNKEKEDNDDKDGDKDDAKDNKEDNKEDEEDGKEEEEENTDKKNEDVNEDENEDLGKDLIKSTENIEQTGPEVINDENEDKEEENAVEGFSCGYGNYSSF